MIQEASVNSTNSTVLAQLGDDLNEFANLVIEVNLIHAMCYSRVLRIVHISWMHYRSVHNVHIECLWVDVTAQVGTFWTDIFTELELHYGLDINNIHHIWPLHHLFLHLINQQLTFFVESSRNQHQIQIRDGPNQSSVDMFGFDMLVHSVAVFFSRIFVVWEIKYIKQL